MAASALRKNIVSIQWMSAIKETKNHCTLEKKLFPAIKHSNLLGKNVFRNNYFGSQPFLLSCDFTKIFVRL